MLKSHSNDLRLPLYLSVLTDKLCYPIPQETKKHPMGLSFKVDYWAKLARRWDVTTSPCHACVSATRDTRLSNKRSCRWVDAHCLGRACRTMHVHSASSRHAYLAYPGVREVSSISCLALGSMPSTLVIAASTSTLSVVSIVNCCKSYVLYCNHVEAGCASRASRHQYLLIPSPDTHPPFTVDWLCKQRLKTPTHMDALTWYYPLVIIKRHCNWDNKPIRDAFAQEAVCRHQTLS